MLRHVILLPTALGLFATAVAASPPAQAAVEPGPAFDRPAGCRQIDGVITWRPRGSRPAAGGCASPSARTQAEQLFSDYRLSPVARGEQRFSF